MRIPILYRIQELTAQGKITDATIFEDVWTAVSELDPDGRILQELHASAILRSIPDRSDVFTLLAEMKQFALEHGGREIRSSAGLASGTVFGEGGEVKLEPPPAEPVELPAEEASTMDRIREGAADWKAIIEEDLAERRAIAEFIENRKRDEPASDLTDTSSAEVADANDKKETFAQCTNPDCPIGCPEDHATPPSYWRMVDEAIPPKGLTPEVLTPDKVEMFAQYGESLLMRNPGDDDPVLERLHTVSQAFAEVHRSDVEAAARALQGTIPLGCLCGVSVKPCPVHSKEQTDGTTI